MADDVSGPIIIWTNYGCEGWKPISFPSLKEALLGQRHGSEFIITRRVDFTVAENLPPVSVHFPQMWNPLGTQLQQQCMIYENSKND